MDSSAYSLPGMSENGQLFPTSGSVITLGHMVHVPLIRLPSELADGYEPHDTIYPAGHRVQQTCDAGTCSMVYPGWLGWVVPGRGYTGTHPPVSLRPVLTLIYGILGLNRFILPFDWNITNNILRSEILRSRTRDTELQGPDPGPDPGPGPDPVLAPDWSQIDLLRISYLRYTGFKAV